MQSKQIDELSKDELIKIVKRYRKIKYGLIWEDKPETVADRCVNELPVLEEAADLEIANNTHDESPVNLLIEGDNYHALYALTFTHKSSIDFIYIDPPYNTGKAKEWKYNDRYVDVNDPYKHSKWISFIYKRLRLARVLLKQSGIMFISIDDHELPRLTEMCEKIFGEQQVIACIPTIMNFKGNQAQYGFAGTHEYTLVVTKNKQYARFHEFEEPDSKLKDWLEDDIGIYKKGAPLQATGTESTRETRPQMFYPILVSNTDDSVSTITDSEYKRLYNKEIKSFDDNYLKIIINKYEGLGFTAVLPMAGAKYGRWRWGWSNENNRKLMTDVIVNRTKNGISLSKKQRPQLSDIVTKKPKSVFYKPSYSSGNGTSLLKSMFGKKVFDNPKPLDLIKDFIRVGCDKDAVILDFFAGSGTTAHAVLELNHYENRRMQFILATNDESNICEEVCYRRIKYVIEGYGSFEPIPARMRYYRTSFVSKILTDQDKRDFVYRSSELLCIAEGTYALSNDSFPLFRLYLSDKKATLIIYDETCISKSIESFNNVAIEMPVTIYVFSYNNEFDEEDFSEVKHIYNIKPIPEAILNQYRRNRRGGGL